MKIMCYTFIDCFSFLQIVGHNNILVSLVFIVLVFIHVRGVDHY